MANKENKINILITGADGQLGNSIKYFQNKYNNFKFFFRSKNELNIAKFRVLDSFFRDNRIHFVINTAAFTNVDLAEKHKKKCFKVNSLGPKYLSKLSIKYDFILIHISTDYIFDGNKKKRYIENDRPRPLSIYGKSKLEGENLIIKNSNKYIIIRVAWLYGAYKNNFFTKIVKKISDDKKHNIIDTQLAFPASSHSLSRDILIIIENLTLSINKDPYSGIYNYGPTHKPISRYFFAKSIVKILIDRDMIKKITKCENKFLLKKFSNVNSISKNELNIRPNNSMLDNNKFFKKFKIKKRTFKDNLIESINIYINKKLYKNL